MKKKNLLFLLVLCLACLFVLCACNNSNQDSDPAIAIELIANSSDVEIGSFSVSNYSLNVTYKSGKIETIPLTNEMVPDTESLKFYTYGTKEVTFTAFDLNCKHTFNVIQKQIKDAYLVDFVKNPTTQVYERVVEYTGNPFVVKVDGDIPAGATISFSSGSSSFTDVNNYQFIVYITCDSYETKQLVGNFTITKAVYDMSSVCFKGVVGDTIHATYSGEPIELSLDGTIPEGVTPSFKIQSLKSSEYLNSWPTIAGNYLVSASFEADTICHEKIKDISTYLVIDKKEVSLKDVTFDDKELVYDGRSHIFTLTNEVLLIDPSSPLSKLVTFEYEGNELVNAGSYIAKANFTVLDSINYTVVDSLKATITIKKADYDTSNVVFDNDSIVYDTKQHGIQIMLKTDKDGNKTELPKGVVVSYLIDDKSVDYSKGEGVASAGTHIVTAVFTHNNTNYNEIPALNASLRIEQAEIVFDSLQFMKNKDDTSILPESVQYSSEEYVPVLNGLPTGINAVRYEYQYSSATPDGVVIRTTDKCKEARTYNLVVYFTDVDSNYYCESSFMKSFEITTLSISDSELTFDYYGLNKVDDVVLYNYDSKEHYIPLKDKPEYVTSVKYIITNANTSALANGDMPGEYYQDVQLTYFNGLEEVTYTTSYSIEFSITFEISNIDFTFTNISEVYSGNDVHPVFEWSNTSANYNLIMEKFSTISYFYRTYGSSDIYSSVCPVDVGVYEVKAVFSEYLTGVNSDGKEFDCAFAKMTIDKRILKVEDLMAMTINNATTGESMSSKCEFRDSYEYKYYNAESTNPNKIDTMHCDSIYIQEFSYDYDGKKRVVNPIPNLRNYGTAKGTCYYLIGNTTTDTYTQMGSYSAIGPNANVNLTDAGLYVYEMSFICNSNCELDTNCKMYIQIKINMLKYDSNYFEAQNVSKSSKTPTEFDTSVIPFKLNARIVKYNYNGTDRTKPLDYVSAVANCANDGLNYYYLVEYTISFEDENQSIDKSSFAAAVTTTPNDATGIQSIASEGLDPVTKYWTYRFVVKIKYID